MNSFQNPIFLFLKKRLSQTRLEKDIFFFFFLLLLGLEVET